MLLVVVLVVLAGPLACAPPSRAQTYVVDDSVGLGRQFDGIGGLSGGGVSREQSRGLASPGKRGRKDRSVSITSIAYKGCTSVAQHDGISVYHR